MACHPQLHPNWSQAHCGVQLGGICGGWPHPHMTGDGLDWFGAGCVAVRAARMAKSFMVVLSYNRKMVALDAARGQA